MKFTRHGGAPTGVLRHHNVPPMIENNVGPVTFPPKTAASIMALPPPGGAGGRVPKSRFTEEPIVDNLKEHEVGTPTGVWSSATAQKRHRRATDDADAPKHRARKIQVVP